MNQTRMHKRCLAFLLAFTLLICGLPLQSFAEEAPGDLPESSVTGETPADGESQLQEGQEGSDEQIHSDPVDPAAFLDNPEGAEEGIRYVVYHEVTLALPAGEGEEEREATKMADTAMVPHGDLISSIDVPERTGCLFEGWYSEEDLTMAAGDEDTVEEDITLYAKFVKKAGMEEEYNLSYISAEDLDPDSQIVVVSYGLTEEEAAGFIQLRDFTDGDEDGESRGFILTLLPEPEEPPFAWEDLDIPPFILEQVKVVAGMKEQGILDAAGLQKSLVFLEVDEQSVEKILAAYADTDYDQAKLAQAKEDEEERARKEALEAAQLNYPDLTLETDYLEDRISAARLYLDSFYQELVLKGVDPVTYTDIAEAIGLSYAQDEDALLGYLTEELNLNHNIAVSILNELGVEPEEEKKETARFVIFPEEGVWTAGHQYQVEILDTENLRFLDEEEPTGASVIYNNFNIYGEDVDNLRLRASVKLVPVLQVEGVEVGKSLFDVAVSDDGMVPEETEDEIKQLSYSGEEVLTAGDVVGVYDGELLSDGSGVDGEITYVKILADLGGGSYSYGKVDATEVVDLPDSIVLQDDGSFEDGVIVVSLEALDFSDPVYEALNLSASTELNENDWLYFYTGSMADALAADDETLASVTGIGRVKSVEEAEGFVTIRYDAITEEDIEKDETGYFHEGKIDLDVPMTDEEREEIEREISRQITESTVMDRSAAYLTALIADQELETNLDDTEYAEALRTVTFQTEDGESLTLEEVRRLASGSSVEFKADSKPSVNLSSDLKHFSGRKGKRVVVKYGFTVTIHLPNNNKLVIRGEMTAEQEVMYYYSADYWKQTKKGFLGIKYIYQYKFWVEFGVGSYSALGFTATVTTQTEKNNDSAFSKLASGLTKGMDLGKNSGAMKNLVSALESLEKKEQGSGVMGSLPQKYSEFLKDGAEYIKIFDKEIFKVSINLDKIGFCKFSIGLNLVSRLKVNCMLGMGISYGVAKAYSITMYSKDHNVEKSSWDIEAENLRVNLFLFGNIGFKIGVVIDLRLGLISTAFDSVGLQGEIGVYAELYGFIWFEYTYIKKEKSTSLAKGAMYLDVGIYFTLDFYAQVGFGKYSSRKNLYKTEWPLLTLGSKYSPVDFMIKNPNDSRLKIELKNSQHSKTISADVLKMESMDMTNGKVDNNSLDSKDRGSKNYSFKTADGNSYTQYNEKYFSVKVRTTDASGKTLNKTSFLYDPVDNSVHVLPQNGELELWGEITFTYLEQGLSFSTETYSRTMKVHWKGEAVDVPVYFKAMSYDGEKETLQLLNTEYVTGVKGGQGTFTITKQMVDGWWPNLQLVSSMKHDYIPAHKEVVWKEFNFGSFLYSATVYLPTEIDIPGGVKDVACGITAGTQISVTLEEGYYIELIYKPSTVHVWWRLYEPLSSLDLARDESDVSFGTLVTDALPQKIKSGMEQYSYYPVKWTTGEWVGSKYIEKEITRIGGFNQYINGEFQVDPYVVSWYKTKDELYSKQVLGWNMPLTPPSVNRMGYTFKVWIRDDNRAVQEDDRMPARDMNVYARWEKNKYKVTFIVDGEVVETAIAPYDTLVSSIAPELTELGKTVEWFKYYYYDAEKGARGADTEMDGSARVPDYHIAVVGEWRATPHMVNWKSLDESLGETVARYGDKLDDLYKPELDLEDARYEFVGWYVDLFDGNGEQPLDETLVMPDNDIDIIARWEPRPQPVYWIVDALVIRRESSINDLIRLRPSYSILYPSRLITIPRYSYYLVGGQVLGKTELPYGASLDGVTPELTSLPEGKTPVWDQVIPYVDLARYNPNGDFKISAGDVTPIGIASVPAGGLVVMGHLELNEHTISWQVDGEEAARHTVCYSRPLPEAPELEKEGHHLDSWMVGDTLLSQYRKTMPDQDLVITSSWLRNEHRVLWVSSNAKKSMELVQTLLYGDALTPPELEEIPGYTFEGWKIGDRLLTEEDTMPDEDITIVAQYTPNQHMVTWMSEGEVARETLKAVDELVAPIQDLERYGYDLEGWLMEDGTKFETMPMPDEDLVLTAVWTPQSAVMNWFLYDTGNRKYAVLDAEVEGQFGQSLGSQLPETIVNYRKDSRYTYTLYTLPGALDETGVRQQMAAWEEVNDETIVAPGVYTYILQRAPVMVNVSWVYGENALVVPTHWVGRVLTAPKDVPALVGFTFTGWADENGQSYEYPPYEDVTLYPQWEKQSFTITWMDGDTKAAEETVAYGDPLKAPAVSKTGYSLKNWKIGDEIITEQSTMPAQDVTAEAVWEINTYSSAWKVDGETVDKTEAAYGAPIVPPEIAVKEGYTRSVWMYDGAALTGNETMPDHDITISCSFNTVSYTIKWVKGEEVILTQELPYGTELVPPAVSETGLSLVGWMVGTTPLPKKMPAHDVTAVAAWQINKYMVSWVVDGTTEESELLEYGEKLDPPSITKKHYTLSPWMNGTVPLIVGVTTVPDHEITLTASWIPNQNKATWVDGKNTLDTQTLSYGRAIPAGPSVENRTGWDFEGWYLDGKKVTSKTTMPDEDITIEASWKKRSHKVYWTIDGDVVKTETVAYGDELDPPSQKKTGFTLSDWKVKGNKLTSSFTMPDESVTVTASWTRNQHTVKWTIDGDTVSEKTVAYDSLLEAPVVSKKPGHELTEWKLDGKKLSDDARMPDEDIEIKASWEHNTHVWDEGEVTKEATCTKEGLLVKKCLYCDEKQEIELGINPDNHTNVRTEKRVEATCGEDGYEGDTFCRDCGVLIAEGKSIPMTGAHNWDNGVVTREATCLLEGIVTQTCQNCGETLETTTPVNPGYHEHTTIVNKVTVSCFTDGYTGDERCEDCGTVLVWGEVVPSKMAHTWQAGDVVKAATDTEPGLMEYTCLVCGQTTLGPIPVETLLRAWEEVNIPSDSLKGYQPLLIEKLFETAEDQGAQTLSQIDPGLFFQACVGSSEDMDNCVGIRAALSWKDESTEIASLKNGQLVAIHIKPEDPDLAKEADVNVVLVHVEHIWEKSSMVTPATCTHTGSGGETCKICGQTRTYEIPVDPENHKGETYVVDAKEATETNTGYTGDTICADCGELIREGTVIPKLTVPEDNPVPDNP